MSEDAPPLFEEEKEEEATAVKISNSPSFSLSGQMTSRETTMALLKRYESKKEQ